MGIDHDVIYQIIAALLLGIIIYAEHALLATPLADNELTRRIIGIATVMGFSLPLAITGIIHLPTWLYIMALFCVAGSITGLAYAIEHARRSAPE